MLMSPSLGHDTTGRNGGRVVDAGNYHVELVVKGRTIDVFLSDHDDRPMAVSGHKALAILAAQGKSQRVVLAPAGDNRLTGLASVDLAGDAKGVVQVSAPGGKTVQARFD